MILHPPQWQRVRQLLAEGALGRLWRIDGAFSYNNRDAANIRNQAGMGGGGLRDIGVYVIGGTRFATGLEGTEVQARIHADPRRTLADREPLRAAGGGLQPRGARGRGLCLPARVLARHPGDGRHGLCQRPVLGSSPTRAKLIRPTRPDSGSIDVGLPDVALG